jgi:hypothetical protein
MNAKTGRARTLLDSPQATVWIPLGLLLALIVYELASILVLNHGLFTYTLDDPYIHLALAESIARGSYGINPGELSAPSSSIVWPFLLAPFFWLRIDSFAPLLINILVSAGIVLLLRSIVLRAFDALAPSRRQSVTITAVLALLLSTNVVGLAFTGMEHSLQVLLALAMVDGMTTERSDGSSPWWLGVAIVAGPLVRYENLALSVPALVYLLWKDNLKLSIISGIILAGLLSAYSFFLYSVGLGFLPASVLAKSSPISSHGSPFAVLKNFLHNTVSWPAALFLTATFLLVYAAFSARDRRDRGLAAWASTAAVLHLLIGAFGWFERYEAYAWSTVLVMVIYLYREPLCRWISVKRMATVIAFMAVAVFVVCRPYLRPTVNTPLAANNIYEQQYQMHRFAVEYVEAPVAVNDIGWVSYQNDNYVLDLAGLSTPQSLHARGMHHDPDWMNASTLEHDVKAVMIYDEWFPRVPQSWAKLGTLSIGKRLISPASPSVTFFAVDPGDAAHLTAQLREFTVTLPEDVRFEFSNTDTQQQAR